MVDVEVARDSECVPRSGSIRSCDGVLSDPLPELMSLWPCCNSTLAELDGTTMAGKSWPVVDAAFTVLVVVATS